MKYFFVSKFLHVVNFTKILQAAFFQHLTKNAAQTVDTEILTSLNTFA